MATTNMKPIFHTIRYLIAWLNLVIILPHYLSWCTPKLQKSASITATEIQNCVEKHFLSKEIEAIRKKLPDDPVINFGDPDPISDSFFLIWRPHGTHISFDGHGIFIALFFYSGLDGENLKYPDELPLGLSFSDSQADVENKLKNPIKEKSHTTDGITKTDWNYPSLGLRIGFVFSKNKNAMLDYVAISKPEK